MITASAAPRDKAEFYPPDGGYKPSGYSGVDVGQESVSTAVEPAKSVHQYRNVVEN
jgi:hypothetical protein